MSSTIMDPTTSQQHDRLRVDAAATIQHAWRKRYKAAKRTKEEYLGSSVRWEDATTHARLKVGRDAAEENKNSPRERWKRAAFLASRLHDPNAFVQEEGVDVPEAMKKILETQHWLELVDPKHRYGSNLKFYHRRWVEEDTSDNFFRWLDKGGGMNLSLKECSREQLEAERIIYLSPEQRLNYLVEIDDEGKLRWKRNNQLIDTTAGHWKDAGHGSGIVPIDLPIAPGPKHHTKDGTARRTSFHNEGDTPVPTPVIEDEEKLAADHYTEHDGFFKTHFTTKGLVQKLLRKTVRKNTWIYVSDKHFNLFIGIKETGAFQHSSLLGGGVVTSAGLITVKEGVIHKLDPLSGHYRTSVDHFRRFIKVLNDRGVDMHAAQIGKAEIALWAIEHIKKWKKQKGEIAEKGKQSLKKVVDPRQWSEDSSWKRDIIEGRRKKKDGESSNAVGHSMTGTTEHNGQQLNLDDDSATAEKRQEKKITGKEEERETKEERQEDRTDNMIDALEGGAAQ